MRASLSIGITSPFSVQVEKFKIALADHKALNIRWSPIRTKQFLSNTPFDNSCRNKEGDTILKWRDQKKCQKSGNAEKSAGSRTDKSMWRDASLAKKWHTCKYRHQAGWATSRRRRPCSWLCRSTQGYHFFPAHQKSLLKLNALKKK